MGVPLNMRSWLMTISGAQLGLAVLLSIGCSSSDKPELVEVNGTLMKDGKPFVGALVEFFPDANAGVSVGQTDDQGNFKLSYTTGEPGAAIGKHTVNVTGGRVAGDPEPVAPPTPKVDLAAMNAINATGESTEALAPVADPTKPTRNSGGPPAPIVLSAEVLAESTSPIVLTMP